jgi:pyridoxine 5-phosphate synthase
MARITLGINIDHVATLRNARGGTHPDTLRAAECAKAAGVDGLTVHLREDRRHILDNDVDRLMAAKILPLNLEMAATEEMVTIALHHRPFACCIVPEKREERTTEGGLDAAGGKDKLAPMVRRLSDSGIRVSLFVEPEKCQLEAAHTIGAPVVELHTGGYAEALLAQDAALAEAQRQALKMGAHAAADMGLEVHAGHGLTYDNVGFVAALPEISSLQIGHFLVGEAVFVGLEAAIRKMRAAIDTARN